MISISVDEAFQAYEAVRHRLPAAVPSPTPPRQIQTLEDIADAFDVFLLDAFGVLNIGDTAIPGVRERIEAFRNAGKRVLVVSNAASMPPDDLQEKYHRLGYDIAQQDIITSRAAMAASIEREDDTNWGVMLAAGAGLGDLSSLNMTQLADDPGPYRDVGGFILIGSGSWTEARQALLEEALKLAPRRVLVANPDIVAPRETGFSAEPGHFAHRLADQTGIAPEFFGKPFTNIFDLAFDRLGGGR